jgi:YVTN family beta-propeller protein
VIESDDGPAGFFAVDGVLYVVTHRSGTIQAIDPATNQVTRSFHVGDQVGSFAPPTAGPFLWACTNRDGVVHQVDVQHGAVTASVPGHCDGSTITLVGDQVWVVPGPDSSEVLRLDATTAAILGTVSLRDLALSGTGFGPALPWAGQVVIGSDPPGASVGVAVDGTGAKDLRIDTPRLTLVNGIFYSISRDGQLTERDPATLAVKRTYAVPKPEGDISLTADDAGHLYYRSNDTTISRIDTATGTVDLFLTTPPAEAATGITFAFGSLWVTNFSYNTIWRVQVS